ncbi:MAG: hypothetical protein COC15_02130 [Legionellales bacterium]|nr:MAG: hypothetical protein COC15_02130 [Legionellales bacterium]
MLLLFATTVTAVTPQCNEVVLTGDADWAPYVVRDGDKFTGVAVELARKIFGELDIKTSFVPMYSKVRVAHAMQYGDIDVLVSTYNFDNISNNLEVIQPGYISDPLKIVMLAHQAEKISRWQDLTGLTGLMSLNSQPDAEFIKFSSKNLYVRPYGDVNKILKLLTSGKTDYLLGSGKQLKYWMQQQHIDADVLEFIKHFSRSAKIYMALSKKSACYSYNPYIRKRLIELQQDGTVARLIAQYLPNDVLPDVVTVDDIDLLLQSDGIADLEDDEIFLEDTSEDAYEDETDLSELLDEKMHVIDEKMHVVVKQ